MKSSFNKLLWASFFTIGFFIISRMIFMDSIRYLSMVWNLFLAWVPYVLSFYFINTHRKISGYLLFSAWLLFLPNAFYLITDLIHLNGKGVRMLWFDAALLFACAFVGVLMGFISLIRAEAFLRKQFSPKRVFYLMPIIFFLNAFGIYLGRFERWNSWDIISKPASLLASISENIISPIENMKTWGVTVVFTILTSLLYLLLKSIPKELANN